MVPRFLDSLGPAIPADAGLGLTQHTHDGEAGQLAVLIRLEDFRSGRLGSIVSARARPGKSLTHP